MPEPQATGGVVLVGYDGSDHAKGALRETARLFPGRATLIATAWKSFGDRLAGKAAVSATTIRELDEADQADAAQLAEEGAAVARDAGLDARATTIRAEPSVWAALTALAEERQALAIVVGSRGRSPVRSAVLGSVSNGIVHHARRPVVVVHLPSDAGP